MASEIKWSKETKEVKGIEEPGESFEEAPEQKRLKYATDSVKEALEKIDEGKIEEAREIIDLLRLLHPVQLERVLSIYPGTKEHLSRVGIKTEKAESRIGVLDHTPELHSLYDPRRTEVESGIPAGKEPETDNLKKSLDNIFNPQPTSVQYQPNPVSTEREEEFGRTNPEDVIATSQGMVDDLRESVDEVFGSSYTPSKKKL